MFSLKDLRISPEVSGFMIRLGCLGFGRGKPLTNPKASSSVGGDLPPTVRVSVRTRAGCSGIRVGWTVLGLRYVP